MWCAIELVSKLRVRQGILGLDLMHRKKRSSGFKLFFKLWGVTPQGVKHALASKALSINITYMFIITSNISPLNLKVGKQLLKP
jgi:hypothetical protein